MKRNKLYWIKWRLWDAALMIYIHICRFGRSVERRWIKHRAKSATWETVWRYNDKWKIRGQRHANRLNYLSSKTDAWFYKWLKS